MPKYYKCLTKNRTGGYSKFVWPEKGVGLEPISGHLALCGNGYHACGKEYLIDWILDGPVYEFIPSGEVLVGDNKICCRGGMLGEKLNWGRDDKLLFQADCAARVLHLFEKQYPNDSRVRNVISAYYGLLSDDVINKKRSAARAASMAAARDASMAAAGDAAVDAARAASMAAARDASMAAAIDAANAASMAAAGDAVWSAARDAEREWQTRQLAYRLGIYKTPAPGFKKWKL